VPRIRQSGLAPLDAHRGGATRYVNARRGQRYRRLGLGSGPNRVLDEWPRHALSAGHRLRQQERRLALGMGRGPDDSLVFARWDGSTPAPHWLTQRFALAMDALGFECTLHALRHTHVSQLIAAGMGYPDNQPPARPCFRGDYSAGLWSPVHEHGCSSSGDHGSSVCSDAN
jgi:integrase